MNLLYFASPNAKVTTNARKPFFLQIGFPRALRRVEKPLLSFDLIRPEFETNSRYASDCFCSLVFHFIPFFIEQPMLKLYWFSTLRILKRTLHCQNFVWAIAPYYASVTFQQINSLASSQDANFSSMRYLKQYNLLLVWTDLCSVLRSKTTVSTLTTALCVVASHTVRGYGIRLLGIQ